MWEGRLIASPVSTGWESGPQGPGSTASTGGPGSRPGGKVYPRTRGFVARRTTVSSGEAARRLEDPSGRLVTRDRDREADQAGRSIPGLGGSSQGGPP